MTVWLHPFYRLTHRPWPHPQLAHRSQHAGTNLRKARDTRCGHTAETARPHSTVGLARPPAVHDFAQFPNYVKGAPSAGHPLHYQIATIPLFPHYIDGA